jgi:hypothetical protein
MSLTDEQKKQVAAWIEAGAKPADVQTRLEAEFGLRVTYMEVRFLIDDLKVMPRDPAPAAAEKVEGTAAAAVAESPGAPVDEALGDDLPLPPDGEGTSGKVAVNVDSITRPGAMVSGSATMSDGKKVDWYLDQYGRLGMVPPEPGYRPPQGDLVAFQAALEKELMKQGY